MRRHPPIPTFFARAFCSILSTHACKHLLLCLIDPCMQAPTCLFDRMEYRDQHCSTVPPIRERHTGAPRSRAYRSTGSVAASACLSRRFCTEFRRLVFYFYPNFSYMFVVFNLDSLFLDFSYYQFFYANYLVWLGPLDYHNNRRSRSFLFFSINMRISKPWRRLVQRGLPSILHLLCLSLSFLLCTSISLSREAGRGCGLTQGEAVDWPQASLMSIYIYMMLYH
jgi:hypothetical protein